MMTSDPRRFDTGGDLFEHLPGILNYTPDRQLVVLGHRNFRVVRAATVSLTRYDVNTAQRHAMTIAAAFISVGCTNAKLLWVDPEDSHWAPGRSHGLRDVMTRVLQQHGLKCECFRARRILAGEQWVFVDDQMRGDPIYGVIGDPSASIVLADSVLRGDRQFLSKQEIEQMFAVAPAPHRAQIASMTTSFRSLNWLPGSRLTVADLERSADIAAAGSAVGDQMMARTITALRRRRILSRFMALAINRPDDAVSVFARQLAAVAAGRDRANACVVAAANGYARGYGAFAGTALDAALDADSGHRLARAMMALYHQVPSEQEWREAITAAHNLPTTLRLGGDTPSTTLGTAVSK